VVELAGVGPPLLSAVCARPPPFQFVSAVSESQSGS